MPWSNPNSAPLLVGLAGFVYPNYRGNRILTWTPQDSATQYDIWINYLSGGQPPQSQIYRNMAAIGGSIQLPSNLPAGQYRVWMRGVRIDGAVTLYSEWTNIAMTFSLP